MLQAWKEKDAEQRIKMAHSVLAESQQKYILYPKTICTLTFTRKAF